MAKKAKTTKTTKKEMNLPPHVCKFSSKKEIHYRALQIYLVLIGLAWNRQTITYSSLSKGQMGGYGLGGILASPLGCIMGWCDENNLPALTSLVVNSVSGSSGNGLITIPNANTPNIPNANCAAEQQRVFNFNWFSIEPPNPEDLRSCGRRAKHNNIIQSYPPKKRIHFKKHVFKSKILVL